MSKDSVRQAYNATNVLSKSVAQQGINQLQNQAELIRGQSELASATSEFAKASLVNQTGHGIAAKLIGLAKTVVQGYLGVA